MTSTEPRPGIERTLADVLGDLDLALVDAINRAGARKHLPPLVWRTRIGAADGTMLDGVATYNYDRATGARVAEQWADFLELQPDEFGATRGTRAWTGQHGSYTLRVSCVIDREEFAAQLAQDLAAYDAHPHAHIPAPLRGAPTSGELVGRLTDHMLACLRALHGGYVGPPPADDPASAPLAEVEQHLQAAIVALHSAPIPVGEIDSNQLPG